MRELLSRASCLELSFFVDVFALLCLRQSVIFFFPRTSTLSISSLACSLVLPLPRGGWETLWHPLARPQAAETMSAPWTPTADAGKDAWSNYNARIQARQGEQSRCCRPKPRPHEASSAKTKSKNKKTRDSKLLPSHPRPLFRPLPKPKLKRPSRPRPRGRGST